MRAQYFTALLLNLFWIVPGYALDDPPGEEAIKSLLTSRKSWVMYWELTDTPFPSERAHKLTYEFFERDQKLIGHLVFEYGGCDFEVKLRPDGIALRYCVLEGEPSLTFDPNDAKYPFKERSNPRKLWLTPKS
jgi:hypothetical protein